MLKNSLCSSFAAITFIILAGVSVLHMGRMDMDSVFTLMWRTVPPTIIMAILGRFMGSILDSPKNLADSDYRSDVLSALKKMDKKMTLADLSQKLAPIPEEPQIIELQAPPEAELGESKNEPTE